MKFHVACGRMLCTTTHVQYMCGVYIIKITSKMYFVYLHLDVNPHEVLYFYNACSSVKSSQLHFKGILVFLSSSSSNPY